MTISLYAVKRGMRVRLTASNGDTTEFTVDRVSPQTERIDSVRTAYFTYQWESFEIVPDPIPTKPGVYVTTGPLDIYVLEDTGIWWEADAWVTASKGVPTGLTYLGSGPQVDP